MERRKEDRPTWQDDKKEGDTCPVCGKVKLVTNDKNRPYCPALCWLDDVVSLIA